MAQVYPEFASNFTGSLANLQENPCLDEIKKETPVDIPCPTCIPDPSAIVPDWTTMRDREVFLNKKTCQYSIVIVTQYNNVGGPDYPNRVAEWAPTAARELLRYYDKLETDLIVNLLVNGYEGSGPIIQATDWFVPLEPNSNLKLLFTINAFNFDGISSTEEDPQVDALTTGATTTAPNQIKLELASLQNKLDRLTRVLAVYGKFQVSFEKIDNGFIYVAGTNREFVLGGIKEQTSLVYEFSQIDNAINKMLNDHNYESFGLFFPPFSSLLSQVSRRADYITLGINEQFQLTSVTIHETGCPDFIISENKVKRYADNSPLNNPTIIAYLSRIDEMHDEAMAIEAPQWIEYLLKYTYPTLTVDYGAGTIFDDVESLGECIASAVSEYGNTQINKLLDSLYSFSDLVADRLNQITCVEDGVQQDQTFGELFNREKGEAFNKIIQSVQNSEIFKTISIIKHFRDRAQFIREQNGGRAPLDKMFDSILDEYGYCGLLGLIQAAIQCLVSGFSYEELLKKIIKAGLKNLTPLQVSRFFVFLPSDKKAEVIAEVDNILKQNDLVSELFNTFDAATSEAVSGVTSPFDSQRLLEIAAEKSKSADNAKSAEEVDKDLVNKVAEKVRKIGEQIKDGEVAQFIEGLFNNNNVEGSVEDTTTEPATSTTPSATTEGTNTTTTTTTATTPSSATATTTSGIDWSTYGPSNTELNALLEEVYAV